MTGTSVEPKWPERKINRYLKILILKDTKSHDYSRRLCVSKIFVTVASSGLLLSFVKPEAFQHSVNPMLDNSY